MAHGIILHLRKLFGYPRKLFVGAGNLFIGVREPFIGARNQDIVGFGRLEVQRGIHLTLLSRRGQLTELVSRIRSSYHDAAGSFANFGFERTREIYNSSVVLVRKFS